jgi:hypothetical protein
MKKKWIRYVAGAIIVCAALWAVLLAIALIYIRINKEEIVASVKSAVSKKILGTINFNDFHIDLFQNFPGISINVKSVHLRDPLFSAHKKELANIGEVYMGFGIIDLLMGNKVPKYVTLANGVIYFYKDSAGNRNWDILKQANSPRSQKILLRKIKLKNINAFFQDNGKRKFFNIWFDKMKCGIEDGHNEMKFEFDNKAIIRAACFNTLKGSYLTNKKMLAEWDMSYDKTLKKLSFRNETVKFNRQSYRLSGNFFLDDDRRFDLMIRAASLSLAEAASIFPDSTAKKIGKFEVSKPLRNIEAAIAGPMKYLSFPLATVSFSVSNATVKLSPTSLQHCSFNGFLKNQIDTSKLRDDRNTYLQFTDVRGEWENTPFDSKNITVYNLITPYLRCNIHTRFDLAQLDKAIASRLLDFNSGSGEATVEYAGPLETKVDTTYSLDGRVMIRNAHITYNPRSLDFKKTDIELEFKEGDLIVKRMNTLVNANNIRINGRVNDFITFFNTDPSKAMFDWNIYSPSIDINKLRPSLRRSSISKKKKQAYSFFERLNNKIDRLFDACNASLDIHAEKVIYRNFSAANVTGRLLLTNEVIRVDNFSLVHAGGSVNVNASSKDNGNNSDLVLQSRMQNVDVKELFNSFNNFGLESLTSKNISGSFSADINLTSKLDANGDLYKAANRGWVEFSLKNGRLENFKPLMDIDNNFLQKRDLSNVSFAELKTRLDLNGNDIRVNRMEIRSTAVNMYVEGTFSFANNTDLSIQIPLKDQKKDQKAPSQNKGANAKTGMSIFLRAKDDKDGKLKINYDLLGRFRSKD